MFSLKHSRQIGTYRPNLCLFISQHEENVESLIWILLNCLIGDFWGSTRDLICKNHLVKSLEREAPESLIYVG